MYNLFQIKNFSSDGRLVDEAGRRKDKWNIEWEWCLSTFTARVRKSKYHLEITSTIIKIRVQRKYNIQDFSALKCASKDLSYL